VSGREDRELQIRLSELQMDLQIQISNLFGLLAVEFALFLAFFQTGFALMGQQPVQILLFTLMIFLICLIAYTFNHFLKRIERLRKQTRKLRKDYAW
jgi:hypothetical protein